MLTTHMTSTESDLIDDSADVKVIDNAGNESADTTKSSESNSISPLVRVLCSELIEHASVLQSF